MDFFRVGYTQVFSLCAKQHKQVGGNLQRVTQLIQHPHTRLSLSQFDQADVTGIYSSQTCEFFLLQPCYRSRNL